MKKFYVVAHSHLDREWYRTFQENRIKLVRFMDDLLDTMDSDLDYTYYNLDAQTSFIDDYFDVKPENMDRFKKHVKSGRLPIGPWYVQPDEHLPTAEGIIRNLLISKKISDEYTDYNRVGYVPDSFGQSATYPTLMKGFGIDSAILYRGFAEEDSKYNDFIWEGLDGSQIIANWMPIGYGNAMFFNEDEINNIKVVEENIELLEERSVSENYLLMCGSDQSFVKKFLPSIIKKLNKHYQSKGLDYEFVLATPQHYIDAISNHKDRMEIVKGELRKGKRSRTHNSIGATRLDIKKSNFEIENKYLYTLEPLSAVCELFGMEEDETLINRGWKYIVENHAHDSICCCCTDAIHDEIMERMKYADQLANYLIKEKLEGLHERIRYIKGKGRPILLFSSNVHQREQIIEVDVYVKDKVFTIFNSLNEEIEYEIISSESFNLKDTKVSFTPIPDDFYDKVRIRLKSSSNFYGYETIYIKEGIAPSTTYVSMIKGNKLNNGLIEVYAEENGSFTIKDLKENKVFKNQHVIVDDGNAGDEYDYSPSFNDFSISSIESLKDISILEDSALKASIQYTYVMLVPKSTSNEKRSDDFCDIKIVTTVSIYKNDNKVYFKTKIDNKAENHRMQVYFDGEKKYNENIADIQLGEIVRKNEFELTKASEQSWHERYYPVFDNHKYSGLKDENQSGFIILNKGLPQYEIYQNDTTQLALTLLSCVGNMGNTDLKYRPGRRSGSTDKTPDSQMLKEFTCEYAFMPINSETDYIQVAHDYINPIKAVCFPKYSSEGYLPDSLEVVSANKGVLVTTLKNSENHDGHILRLLNPYIETLDDISIQVNRHLYSNIERVDLAERSIPLNEVSIKKLNNPDGSAMAIMSGNINISKMNRNSLMSFRLKK